MQTYYNLDSCPIHIDQYSCDVVSARAAFCSSAPSALRLRTEETPIVLLEEAPSSFLFLAVRPGAPFVASLFLVAMPFAPSSVLAPIAKPSVALK